MNVPEETVRIISCENVCKLQSPKYSRKSKKPSITAKRVPIGKQGDCEVYSCNLGKKDCSLLELYEKFGRHSHIYTVPPGAHGSIYYFTAEPRLPRLRNNDKKDS